MIGEQAHARRAMVCSSRRAQSAMITVTNDVERVRAQVHAGRGDHRVGHNS